MQIGPQQQQIEPIDIARARFIDVEHGERRAIGGERLGQRAGVGLRAGKTQQRIAVADAVMQRRAVARAKDAAGGRPAKSSARIS